MSDAIDFAKFVKYSKSGPRYTSYPTAVEFTQNWQDNDYMQALNRADKLLDLPLSLYVHLPFCRSACYFCGCNSIYTSKEEKSKDILHISPKSLLCLQILWTHHARLCSFILAEGRRHFSMLKN